MCHTDVFYVERVRGVSMPKEEYFLFSDASFDRDSRVGVGATLTLTEREWYQRPRIADFSIKTAVIASKTIARLELMTALWVLDNFRSEYAAAISGKGISIQINLFTDCKTIADLPHRRNKLEANHYQSKRTKLSLANADLYRQFFEVYDHLHPNVVWIKGHSPSLKHSKFQRVFATVDKAARQRMREFKKTI